MSETIHNYSEIPELILKRIDPAKDISEIVEVFNYNMGQIYRWWKNSYQTINNNISNGGDNDNVVVIHGINIKGDKGKDGDKGNSIFFVNTPILPNQTVTTEEHKIGDFVISGDSIFEITGDEDLRVYSFVGNIGGGKFILPTTGFSPTSHSVIDWNSIDNSATSILSPYKKTGDVLEYYRINIGDYKKSSSLNSSLALTNILEKKNDGSAELPIDANDVTSRDFAQLILQYRKGYNGEISAQTITHKFYESADNGFVYNITNGVNQLNLATISNNFRWMTGDTSTDGVVEIKSLNVKFFANQSVIFYHDYLGDNYYLAKLAVPAPNKPNLNLGFNVRTNTVSVYDDTVGDYIPAYALPYQIIEIDVNLSIVPTFLLDNFTPTGLGKNLYKGWAMANGNNGTRDRKGRTSIGYDPSLYPTLGYTGGSKDAVVVAHTHGQRTSSANGFDLPQIKISGGGTKTGVSGDTSSAGTRMQVMTDETGVDGTDKNMQPYIVTLILMKLP